MPTLHDNIGYWDQDYDWNGGGDEWSEHWGTTEAMWRATITPRIDEFLPTGTLLEIAPGFGRWTQFLRHCADRVVVVDVASRCIEACRERFVDDDHFEYHIGDGSTLEGVSDRSIDFAFSFDSLVHVDNRELYSYVAELGRVLSSDGVAFIHHSNLGAFPRLASWVRRAPLRFQLFLNRNLINLSGWRCEDATAEGFRTACQNSGLSCFHQENIVWLYGRKPIDTLSLVTRPGSRWDRPYRTIDNLHFMREAKRAKADTEAHS